jgi:hypothetical protein
MLKRAYIFATVTAMLAGAVGGAWAGGTRGGPGGGALAPATISGNASIQLPKGWASIAEQGQILAKSPTVDKDSTGQYQATLTITQTVGNKVDGASQEDALAKALPGYVKVERPTPAAIGGLTGVKFGGTFKRDNVELRSRQYMFAVNNQVFTITFTSLSSKWTTYQGLVEASAATFAVKK